MPSSRVASLALLALLASLASPGAASAGQADPPPTTATLAARSTYAGVETTLRGQVVDAEDEPLADVPVTVERRLADGWRQVARARTGAAGRVEVAETLYREPSLNVFRLRYAGDDLHAASGSGPVRVALTKRRSVLQLLGPDTVVDERRLTLRLLWRTPSGEPVQGRVRVQRRLGDGGWKRFRTVSTDRHGRASWSSTPRQNSRWRARGRAQSWVEGDRSRVHRVDNLPPGTPVSLPRAAPRPRTSLPPQPHAVGEGAHATISRIPDGVWGQMTGRTWHEGCPVGREGLRYLRVNYWDYAGYRRRGEMVVNADVAGKVAAALAEMYSRELAIRAMYRVDRFGYSSRVHGGDDYASMAAGNTSGFNCRDVVGRPGVRSPHSWGRSIDLNTWENPYRSAHGLVPNTWWQSHSHPRVAWRSRAHAVVQVMARHGIRWTYGLDDTQHFDAVSSGSRALAERLARRCGGIACD